MIEKFLFLISITLILLVITEETEKKNLIEADTNPIYVDYNIPYLQKNFVAFKEAVAFKESQGKYKVINTLGYLGKYQFGRTTLERFRIYNTKAFLNNPEQQEKAFIALCSVNKWILRKDIKRSVGKTINGIKITESGILASAHLSGAGNVKKFLRSNGNVHFKDAYGATIQMYMKKFSGYDVSFIKANRKAKV
jgi:hypothetical protein